MNVAEAVGETVIALGVDQVFGVVGSGNFHVTNAMTDARSPFVAARHEGGAATMADAYRGRRDTVAAVTVHQGCGLTNAMTGITEAAKSRTAMLVLAAEVTKRARTSTSTKPPWPARWAPCPSASLPATAVARRPRLSRWPATSGVPSC